MNVLHRRLLRLESRGGRYGFAHLTDDELGRRLRAELADWLRSDPAPLPGDLRAELAAFLAAPAATAEAPA
jgi:hypothetical protein